MSPQNVSCASALVIFVIEQKNWLSIKGKDNSKGLNINGRDDDRKIISWDFIFNDCRPSSCGSHGPLICVLRDESTNTDDVVDPILPSCYYGESGRFISVLDSRLPNGKLIFKNENNAVFMKIKEATRGMLVESTIKSFSRHKDGRGAF